MIMLLELLILDSVVTSSRQRKKELRRLERKIHQLNKENRNPHKQYLKDKQNG